MKQQLSQAGKSGWTLIDLLADFHLLLFLTDLLGMDEVRWPQLCRLRYLEWKGAVKQQVGRVPVRSTRLYTHPLITNPTTAHLSLFHSTCSRAVATPHR